MLDIWKGQVSYDSCATAYIGQHNTRQVIIRVFRYPHL